MCTVCLLTFACSALLFAREPSYSHVLSFVPVSNTERQERIHQIAYFGYSIGVRIGVYA